VSWYWLPPLLLGALLLGIELRLSRHLSRRVSLRRLGVDAACLLALTLLLVASPLPDSAPVRAPLNVAFVVDVSASMAARDETPDRLEKGRQIIRHWLEALPGARGALVPFAGEAVVQVPLTADTVSLRFFVDQLQPGLVTAPGSAPEEALERAASALQVTTGERLILLLSDGERTLPEPPPAINPDIPVLSVRLGSPQGAPVPDLRGQPRQAPDGSLLQTRANLPRLQQIAERSHGLVLGAGQALAVAEILSRLGLSPPAEEQPDRPRRWLPLLVLALVLLRSAPRLPRRWRLSAAAALAALLLAPMAACGPEPATTRSALLEKAWQAERQGDPESAIRDFSLAAEQLPADLAAAASYNAASLALKAGHPERAVPLLELALRLAPGDRDAAHNLALALRQLPPDPPGQPGTASGQPQRPSPGGRIALHPAQLGSALRPAPLRQPPLPVQERRVERDW